MAEGQTVKRARPLREPEGWDVIASVHCGMKGGRCGAPIGLLLRAPHGGYVLLSDPWANRPLDEAHVDPDEDGATLVHWYCPRHSRYSTSEGRWTEGPFAIEHWLVRDWIARWRRKRGKAVNVAVTLTSDGVRPSS